MCCSFYYTQKGIKKSIDELDPYMDEGFIFPDGKMGPGDRSLIVTGHNDRLSLAEATWGFPGKEGGLIINARSETALAKPMFSSSVMYRRCAIPAECFFEWDYSKNMVSFTDPARTVMFLAGFWNIYENIMRFVVMTTAANESMVPVHDRMPLMIGLPDVRRWVLDNKGYQQLLGIRMPLLDVYREQEQLSMF
jgi:putative SOS response-associated peptidase YedK